ncbi:MAG: S16 family serine protease [Nanoarchaeota archaeon]|nr:hypothetical protein [Nanoarchaeota archaeon]MBU1632713.1 hypothetical protein [Nanoarchaeota archaeon]MBU1875601.1 hypothetical protein [Nanoarchaeota archaeon]
MRKIWFLLVLSLLPLSVMASNQQLYHLKLLAVQEYDNNTYKGSDADIYLELREGSGRVFLDTFPLTKMDTQISTRFAKEIACNHFNLNCNKYDFIFTIKAKSNIIGGPSAGAAIAALTTIAVLDLNYDEDITITGTINSGGIVGPVGGVKEKLEAASEINLKKVMVSKGSTKLKKINPALFNNTNTTDVDLNETTISNYTEEIDLKKYAEENLSLDLIEVMNLDEVVLHLTEVDLNQKDVAIEENPQYNEIMKGLKELLCSRGEKISEELKKENIQINETVAENIELKKSYAENSTKNNDFYSAASYCFGINILLRDQYYSQKKAGISDMKNLFLTLSRKVNSLEKNIDGKEIETISDLQALIIVKERLADVKEQIKRFNEILVSEDNETKSEMDKEEMYYLLSYAEERYFSAISWMQFFSMDGRKLILNKEVLHNLCLQKITEAEERYQYASIFIGELNTKSIREKLDDAKNAYGEDENELCLVKAIQAKGDSNAILSSMGLTEESFTEFLDGKIEAVKRVIAENSAEGMFPILGYSYFQYASSLKEQEKYSALIYLEYALEMSDLGIYFPEENTYLEVSEKKVLNERWFFVLQGFAVGVILTLLLFVIKKSWFRKPPKLKYLEKD